MDKLKIARQLLSTEILHNFIGRITGSGVERIIGSNPENILLVGKLMSAKDSDGVIINSSKTFIESIGVDFYVCGCDLDSATIKLTPQGDFYYRVYPSLAEQREAMVREVNESRGGLEFSDSNEVTLDYDEDSESFTGSKPLSEQHETKVHKVNEFKDGSVYTDFFEIIAKYKNNPDSFAGIQLKLVPVYKKVSLSSVNAQISFKLKEILDDCGESGYISETHKLNSQLADSLQALQAEVNADPEAMLRVVTESVKVSDLLDEKTFSTFIEQNANSNVVQQNQNWQIYFDIQVKKIGVNYLVNAYLVNNSTVFYSNAHRSRNNDKFTIETLFNSGIRVDLGAANFFPIELDSFADDYKYDKDQYALSNNCSVEYLKDENALQTNHLPLYEQYRLITNDRLAVKFADLIEDPIKTLEGILVEMRHELDAWKRYRQQKDPTLTPAGKEKLLCEIRGFEDEISNFEHGNNVLKSFPLVRESFIQMNQAFAASAKGYYTWRLFQIVFIVSMLPDIVACDPDMMSEEEKAESHLSSIALLYFPTGGGKTEAFLGVLVFNLFFDRHRGKRCGVTSILRYPLRLLSVQQIQRLANILAQAELIRRVDPSITQTEEFSLGYFVGDNNTPNSMNAKEYARYREMTQTQRDEHLILDLCPFCGKPTVHLDAVEEIGRLVHYCDNPDCLSGRILPIYVVDTEIYRYLPSAIISTVDKFAIIGCNANFRNVLNGAEYKCPIHGYTSKRKCIDSNCKFEADRFEQVDMYDPAPTLFIQDELHLMRESLGAYASHYESFIEYYVKHFSKSKRDLKVIGATATISSYREQVYHLYGRDPIRFPCESPFINKNFYAKVDDTDLQRQILGYAPYGKAIVNSVVYSLKYMREAVHEYYHDPSKVLAIPGIGIETTEEALEILKDYWIFLEYNNVKRDGNNVDGAIKTPVNEELAAAGIIQFKTRAMTGDESFQDVREVLAEVENSKDVYDGVNLITATNMISHGVDADRFNIMFFYGIPGNMAEYIQAYSRTGRKHTSIVIDLIRPSRETDLSYLKNFTNIHKYKDLLVEPVPINRWATKAVDTTLPGIFTGLLLTVYDPELQYSPGTLFFMKNIRKAIKNGLLNKDTIKDQLYHAFGCTEDDGNTQPLGNQYSQKISEIVDDLFVQIADRSWSDENIFTGFSMMGYRIMNSLRDTDTALIVELE